MSEAPDDGMAAILAANPVPEPDKPAEVVEADKPALELTDDDEAVDVPEGEEGGEEEPADEHKPRPRRSKPASERIAELTARLREAERALAAKDTPAAEPELVKPNPDDFEYGEADPAYIDKLTDWKIESRDQDKRKTAAVANEQAAQSAALHAHVAKAEVEAKAKYTDFEERVAEAVEARGGETLPPMLSIGVAVSPVAGDLIYRLATDDAASAKLEKLAKGPPQAMAVALGELESEYLADNDDSDLNVTDPLDMARMLGRMRARLKGAPAKPTVRATNAPEPPAQGVRGSSGKFEVGADTTDFAAFEKKANAKR